jgi:hypothetical protein
MLLKTLFIAGSRILNHPGVLEVASSIPNMFAISRNTRSLYKLQITSDRFTLNLFDFREQPLIIRQLLESHVVSSWQCDQNCKLDMLDMLGNSPLHEYDSLPHPVGHFQLSSSN